MTKSSIFFNHSFEKKRLKALISWIHKTFGEKEALRVVDELKVMGFTNATRAGLSIGLHDLITPPEKPLLLSKAQVAMNKTDQDFKGGKITATERSQRIIDTWHRTSDTLRKQVVDHFNTYDQLNSVYIMALSGARGNFSQVRQLIGMRGLMADPQGQIISFPIRSNFREGLTLTEYFISCSGARKGLVDTALRTADTGYLTRRLVDVSHQVVIKRVACHTSRGIVLKPLQTGPVGGTNKIMLSLKDRLIGRVLAEDIKVPNMGFERHAPETTRDSTVHLTNRPFSTLLGLTIACKSKSGRRSHANLSSRDGPTALLPAVAAKNVSDNLADAFYASKARVRFVAASKRSGLANRRLIATVLLSQSDFVENHHNKFDDFGGGPNKTAGLDQTDYDLVDDQNLNRLSYPASTERLRTPANLRFASESAERQLAPALTTSNGSRDQSYKLATRDTEISPNLAFKIACLRDQVVVRSSLTCACTHEVCQLCYGWSLSQGKLVSLGEAVGVIAAQSIGEPGTQLTMRTFHTGGVFSGDLLQDIRAPHAGKVFFPEALQGLLVRTAQGQIAFLIKIPGALLLDDGKAQVTRIQLEAATMVFVRQGEVIEYNTVIGELAVITKEGNQPIKSRQTLFAEFGGRVTHHLGRTLKVHKPELDEEPLSAATRWNNGEELDLVKDAEEGRDRLKNGFRFIEPTHSLSLGVFRILATRIGAKESDLSKVRFSEPYHQPVPSLTTLANLRFAADGCTAVGCARGQVGEQIAPSTNRSYALLGTAPQSVALFGSTRPWKGSNLPSTLAPANLRFAGASDEGELAPTSTASQSKADLLKTDGFVRLSKAMHANQKFASRSALQTPLQNLRFCVQKRSFCKHSFAVQGERRRFCVPKGSIWQKTFGLLRQVSAQRGMQEHISPSCTASLANLRLLTKPEVLYANRRFASEAEQARSCFAINRTFSSDPLQNRRFCTPFYDFRAHVRSIRDLKLSKTVTVDGSSMTAGLKSRLVIVDSISTSCFTTVPRESNSLSGALGKYAVNKLGSSDLPIASENSLANRRLLANFRFVAASKRSYVLNTIADEGDLVDENYKDCTSAFQ